MQKYTPAASVPPLIGDTNRDDVVDFADFLVLSANFGNPTEYGVADGDIDENGIVDFADFLLLSSNFGNS